MSKQEIKDEINKVLDHFPTNALEELLVFLKQLDDKHIMGLDQDQLNKILAEDKELLARLAQ